MEHFVHTSSEALKSLSGGLELCRPDPEKVKGYATLDTEDCADARSYPSFRGIFLKSGVIRLRNT